MDSQSRAKMLLIPNAKQGQKEISQKVHSILASDPNRTLEEVQRTVTLQVLAPWLEHLLVTTEEESNKEHETALRDIEQEASERTQRIFANHKRLSLIVANYGRILQNRWRKRRIDQRKKLLLQAWPGMYMFAAEISYFGLNFELQDVHGEPKAFVKPESCLIARSLL